MPVAAGLTFHNILLSLSAIMMVGIFGWAGNQIFLSSESLNGINVRLARLEEEVGQLNSVVYRERDAEKDFRVRDDRLNQTVAQIDRMLMQYQELRNTIQNAVRLDDIVVALRDRNALLERQESRQDLYDKAIDRLNFRMQALYQAVYGTTGVKLPPEPLLEHMVTPPPPPSSTPPTSPEIPADPTPSRQSQ